ncbi:hypothetical protein ZIOFF_035650 [Zingiber officinale]|uniref:Uncharacterized protein n=1 Tax=Zingiber officinale TaxID=94328 RepID=A0A8J5GEW9_ZINOF|nr:hypothetical protein ZIOFF_035650 [Zingiber officinale]
MPAEIRRLNRGWSNDNSIRRGRLNSNILRIDGSQRYEREREEGGSTTTIGMDITGVIKNHWHQGRYVVGTEREEEEKVLRVSSFASTFSASPACVSSLRLHPCVSVLGFLRLQLCVSSRASPAVRLQPCVSVHHFCVFSLTLYESVNQGKSQTEEDPLRLGSEPLWLSDFSARLLLGSCC